MTVTPARGRDPGTGSRGSAARWRVIESALENWGRTLRLCVILLMASVPPSVIYLGISWVVKR
jgi:hypothetical protein